MVVEYLELIYEKTKGIAPFAYEIVGEWLYFCDLNVPGLFRYHFEKEICECVVPFESKYLNRNFFKMFVYKEGLWMLPFLDGNIVLFNIRTQEVSYYNIPKNVEENKIPFIGIVFSEDKAYFLPHGNNRFLFKIDLASHQMEEIELLKMRDRNDPVIFSEAVQIENRIYLSEGSRNTLFLFDVSDDKVQTIDGNGYSLNDRTVGVIGNRIYFFPWNIKEKLVIYDIEKKNFIKEDYPIKNLPQDEECAVVVFEKDIWILANKKKKIYQLNQNLEIKSITSILNFNVNEKITYVSGKVADDRCFFHGHNGAPLIQVKGGDIQVIDVSKDKNTLELYMDMQKKDCDAVQNKFHKLSIGKLIYEDAKAND